MDMHKTIQRQRLFFQTGKTKSVSFRIKALKRLKNWIISRETDLLNALEKDLNKSSMEGYMTEVGLVLEELEYLITHVEKWTRNKEVLSPLTQFPARSFVMKEPYGVTLIMAPWNYPFLLCLMPAVGAIAAGNCVVIKPSAYAGATSAIVAKMIHECFLPHFVTVVEGGREENQSLLQERFDYIFFTGGVTVGKLVMEAAAKYVTPLTLELGGKSPCIVDETADIALAAKRIAFGKYLNAGQTCIAPDYLFIHKSKTEEFIGEMKRYIQRFFGDTPLTNEDYPKIINRKHLERLNGLLLDETVAIGGGVDWENERMEPTVLVSVTACSKVMQEEIFGPILPILEYENIEEVIRYITGHEKPLACYIFTTHQSTEHKLLHSLSFGGGCVNDTVIHLANPRMAFGGVGMSGMGSYHGKKSFDTFSHEKGIVKKFNWLDLPMRYHPYTKLKYTLIRKFLK